MTVVAGRLLVRSRDAARALVESPWFERMAQWGFVVRGALYLVVAALAAKVATGDPGAADKDGALQAVARQPFGRVLMGAMAVGFAGYALWRFTEAALGPNMEPDARKAALKRVGSGARGLLYAALFASATRLVMNADEPVNRNETSDWTARVLGWPGGRMLVAAVGVGVVAGGLYVGYRGLAQKFRKRMRSYQMGRAERWWILRLGTVGNVARMVVFTTIGALLVVAALHTDPREAVGIDGALRRLAARSWGPDLLLAIAAGLASYGLFSLAEARYRRLEPG